MERGHIEQGRYGYPVTFMFSRCRCEVQLNFVAGNLARYLWATMQKEGLLPYGLVIETGLRLFCPKCREASGDYAESYFPMSVDRWPGTCYSSQEALRRPTAIVELIWQIAELARLDEDVLGRTIFARITERLAHGILQVVRPDDVEKLLTIFKEAAEVTYIDLAWFEQAVVRASHEILDGKARRRGRSQSTQRIRQHVVNLLDIYTKLVEAFRQHKNAELPVRNRQEGQIVENDIQELREAMYVAVHSTYKHVRRLIKTAILEKSEVRHRPPEIVEDHPLWRLSSGIEAKESIVRDGQWQLWKLNQHLRDASYAADTSPWWHKDFSRLSPFLGEMNIIAQKIHAKTPVYVQHVEELDDLLEVDVSGYDPEGKFPRQTCLCADCSVEMTDN